MARIGFIGTGLMGAPMAARLVLHGHTVHVWNRTVSKTKALQKAGAIVESTPRSVCEASELIAVCLTDAPAVEQVLFGGGGAAEARRPLTVVDFTSMSPDQSIEIADRLRSVCGARYVDAPVSGGVAGATEGTLVVMCGGDEQDIARAAPILEAVSCRVTHMGPNGAGQVAKLCNQHIVASSVIAMAEAVAFAQRAGIDVARLPEALAGGFADSKAFRLWGARMAAGSWTPNVGAVDTMWKDVRNVLLSMRSLGLSLPLAGAIEEVYAGISAAGRGRDDLGSLASYFNAGGSLESGASGPSRS